MSSLKDRTKKDKKKKKKDKHTKKDKKRKQDDEPNHSSDTDEAKERKRLRTGKDSDSEARRKDKDRDRDRDALGPTPAAALAGTATCTLHTIDDSRPLSGSAPTPLEGLKQWETGTKRRFKANLEAFVSSIRQSQQLLVPAASSSAPAALTEAVANRFESISIEELKARGGTVNSLCRLVIGQTMPFPEASELLGTETRLDGVMCGYLLPSHIQWPFFGASKQGNAKARNLLFNRLSCTHPALLRESVRVVNDDCDYVAIIGVPGIGKTADMNYLLLQFIAHLGEPRWKNRVFIRIRDVLAEVFLEGETVCYRYYSFENLKCLESLSDVECQQSVLLLELREDENDPDVECPTIVSCSSRRADEMLKTMEKSKRLRFLIAEPHSAAEATCEVLLVNATSKVIDKNIYDLSTVLANHKLDPRPREYLGEIAIRTFDPTSLTELFAKSHTFSPFNVPSKGSHILAPYVIKGVVIPFAFLGTIPVNRLSASYEENFDISGPWHEYRFYNDTLTLEASKHVTTAAHLEALRLVGVLWQIQECHMLYGGLLRDEGQERRRKNEKGGQSAATSVIDDVYSSEHWCWYNNCAPNEYLKTSNELVEDKPSLKRNASVVKFDTNVLKKLVWELQPDRVYHSILHNQWLYDFLFCSSAYFQPASVDVQGDSKRIVYMIQVTDKLVQDHPCSFNAMEKVFEGLGLLTAEASHHISKVVFVMVVPDSRKASSIAGISVKIKEADIAGLPFQTWDDSTEGFVQISWDDAVVKMKMGWKDKSQRDRKFSRDIDCEAYIARARITPGPI